VQGDVHDIGKNIAKVLLENYGFTVVDLGRDVPPEQVVEAARQNSAKLVGLSALMTTTLPAMEATIEAIRAAGLGCKVLVGGAVLTEEYAKKIGADFYAKDATASADYARKLLRGE
ncbi:MAG: cobalamin-dependent protein, partial [Oscillospiraceae bacterium]